MAYVLLATVGICQPRCIKVPADAKNDSWCNRPLAAAPPMGAAKTNNFILIRGHVDFV
jgi:hypothetical protein